MNSDIQLACIDSPNSTRKRVTKSSKEDLVFTVGKSNPAIFLKEFENCDDTKTDKDKLFKIRNFVSPEDKPVFSMLFFKGDWPTARSTFLKKYSIAFTKNKKMELNFTFDEETTLRSFVFRKMKALSTYTRLSVESQLEVILNELPVEVSNLFIVHDKMNCTKIEILEFCDTIQEIMDDCDETEKNVTLTADPDPNNGSQVIQDLGIFSCDSKTISEVGSSEMSSEMDTSDLDKVANERKNLIKKSSKRRRGEGLRGRASKIKKIFCESSEKDDDDSRSSTSTFSTF